MSLKTSSFPKTSGFPKTHGPSSSITYSCSDKDLYNSYEDSRRIDELDSQGPYESFFSVFEKMPDNTEIKLSTMDSVICATSGGTNNIFELKKDKNPPLLSQFGVLGFMDDILSNENRNGCGKPEPSIIEELDCYCIENMSKKLLSDSKCIIDKFPHLNASLKAETKRHCELMSERNLLFTKIKKIKKKYTHKSRHIDSPSNSVV
jgi:hypothetical protein